MVGSNLRGIDAMLCDARAQVSQVKLLINDVLENMAHGEETDMIENLQTALSLLTDLDDR